MGSEKRVHLLDSSVAQRIAAGEVIERPESVVRELIDNSIDAGATAIDLYLKDGGIGEIRVLDNGSGMSRGDLAICCESHATSKIATVEDLYQLDTMGFRGEALYSIAACTDLTIISGEQGETPCTLTFQDGAQKGPVPGGSTRGTSIIARNLFHSIPGRRKFLKRPQAEAAACRKTLIDKALPFPEIAFRFFVDDNLRLHLPAADFLNRAAGSDRNIQRDFLREISVEAGNFSIHAVCATPDLYRTDRTGIKIFVNKRRIQEYSLLQAVSYGYDAYLPGGAFPYCTLFIEVTPELVDFNIHPAKREAKIRPLPQIHHETVQLLKGWLYKETAQREKSRRAGPVHQELFSRQDTNTREEFAAQRKTFSSCSQASHSFPKTDNKPDVQSYRKAFDELLSNQKRVQESEVRETPAPETPPKRNYRYHGQIFNLFLIAEFEERILLIDQHAAHERIIYEELSSETLSQPMLIPYTFEPDEIVETFLLEEGELYRNVGIDIAQVKTGLWELRALPASCRQIKEDILEFIMKSAGNGEEIKKEFFAMVSCRAAVKDGDLLDETAALALIDKALKLKTPRCPHGRPIWKEISREELFQAVKRIF